MNAEVCVNCGHSFKHDFEITLNDALRMGAIIRGMDLDEGEVQEGEELGQDFFKDVLSSGDDALIKVVKQLPEESWGRLKKILNQNS